MRRPIRVCGDGGSGRLIVRVLQVTDWNPVAGGVETYVRDLRPALEAAGMTVRVLTSSAGSAMDGRADLAAWGTSSPFWQAGLQLVNPFGWARMRQAIRRFAPDVVHVHSFAYHLSPAVVLATGHVPVVITIHDYKPVCPLGTKLLPDGRHCVQRAGTVCWKSGCLPLPYWIREKPRHALIARALARGTALLVGSPWMRQALGREGIECEVVVYPVAPPTAAYARGPAAHPVFLYCGRLAREKGVELLLRALARLRVGVPRSRLIVVGDGPERARLQRLAAELGVAVAVHFAGWQPPGDVQRLMGEAWALVVPSLWAEPFGLVALEAITRGLPVVASEAGGLADIVVDKVSGLTFPAGDEQTLSRHLGSIARREAFPTHVLASTVVEEVRAAHTPAQHAERLRGVYRRVLGQAVDFKAQLGGPR